MFSIDSVKDESGAKYWILFEHGKFHKPTAVIGDTEMVFIANRVLGMAQQMRDLGEAIVSFRKLNRMTQDDFAARCGISRNYISQIERGIASNLSLAVHQAIVRAMQ